MKPITAGWSFLLFLALQLCVCMCLLALDSPSRADVGGDARLAEVGVDDASGPSAGSPAPKTAPRPRGGPSGREEGLNPKPERKIPKPYPSATEENAAAPPRDVQSSGGPPASPTATPPTGADSTAGTESSNAPPTTPPQAPPSSSEGASLGPQGKPNGNVSEDAAPGQRPPATVIDPAPPSRPEPGQRIPSTLIVSLLVIAVLVSLASLVLSLWQLFVLAAKREKKVVDEIQRVIAARVKGPRELAELIADRVRPFSNKLGSLENNQLEVAEQIRELSRNVQAVMVAGEEWGLLLNQTSGGVSDIHTHLATLEKAVHSLVQSAGALQTEIGEVKRKVTPPWLSAHDAMRNYYVALIDNLAARSPKQGPEARPEAANRVAAVKKGLQQLKILTPTLADLVDGILADCPAGLDAPLSWDEIRSLAGKRPDGMAPNQWLKTRLKHDLNEMGNNCDEAVFVSKLICSADPVREQIEGHEREMRRAIFSATARRQDGSDERAALFLKGLPARVRDLVALVESNAPRNDAPKVDETIGLILDALDLETTPVSVNVDSFDDELHQVVGEDHTSQLQNNKIVRVRQRGLRWKRTRAPFLKAQVVVARRGG